jgi:predicted ATPase/class 3 adenylate cyclase
MSESRAITGTVTFLFTDIEDSTALWDTHPQGMRAALARHDELVRAAVEEAGGQVVKTTGDGLHAVFPAARGAVSAALAAQKALAAEPWPSISPDALKIRVGIHTGEAEERDGDYYGPAVNRAARLMAIGHGGQVLLSGVTAALVSDLGADVSLNELGDVRLRGLNRPEHVYQLMAEGLPAAFPPLRTEAAVAGNLPQQLTSFVGRKHDKSEVVNLLSTSRLLTLTGPGGTGKTRLSLEVAGDVQDNYANGAWFVELAPLSDPAGVPDLVAGLFGLRENALVPLNQALADYLRGKEMLLILDNCEHLVAASANLAAGLLAVAPRLTILASSREGLGVPGETTYHLPTLRVPDRDVVDVQALREFEGVQLFLDRARAAQPNFTLTPQNAAAVGRIVRRLDGIPLAIELAAARLKLLPPEQLAARLDDRFRLLTGGSRTALPRQQTLRALIDWSYDYLEPAEQALFRQLGVFSGGWSLEAAEYVAAPENLRGLDEGFSQSGAANLAGLDIFDLLANLVNKSLVVMDDQDGQARFSFLETIRQYARDRLFESGEGPAARERHLDFYVDLVLDGHPDTSEEVFIAAFSGIGTASTTAWIERLRPEIDNVRVAMQWAMQTDPERALAMSKKMPLFFIFEGPGLEANQWLTEALQAVKDLEPVGGETARRRSLLIVQGEVWKGNLQMAHGRQAEALETLAAAAEMARQENFPRSLAMALALLAVVQGFLGLEAAYDTATEALAILEELDEPALQGMPLSSMAVAKMRQGDLAAAQALKERALASLNKADSFTEGLQLVTMAGLARQSGDLDEAMALLKAASESFDKIGSRHFRNMAESEFAHLRRYMGDDAAAEAAYRRTIREWQDLGHQAAVANQLETLAFIAVHGARLEHAATLLGAAEALREYIHIDMLPNERAEYDAEVAALEEALDPAALSAAWRAGRQLDMDAAVDLALSE